MDCIYTNVIDFIRVGTTDKHSISKIIESMTFIQTACSNFISEKDIFITRYVEPNILNVNLHLRKDVKLYNAVKRIVESPIIGMESLPKHLKLRGEVPV